MGTYCRPSLDVTFLPKAAKDKAAIKAHIPTNTCPVVFTTNSGINRKNITNMAASAIKLINEPNLLVFLLNAVLITIPLTQINSSIDPPNSLLYSD